ncbi:MAG: hypothetical protein H6644_08405 [Caldilineaceae bacterium]|nr:hypothetical protein [Caldilineaceae bacterium]
MRAGKHILCEKPAYRNLEESKTMLTVTKAGAAIWLRSTTASVPAIRQIRIIDSGAPLHLPLPPPTCKSDFAPHHNTPP